MPAARVPSPEAGAERVYVRDKANVSRPIAWVSQGREVAKLCRSGII